MDGAGDWPEALRAYLSRYAGPSLSIERLGGMSRAAVYRVRGAGGRVIVKSGPSPRERLLYERGAAPLREGDVAIPERLWSAEIAGTNWLVLEDLGTEVAAPGHPSRVPDPRMIATLARLHTLTLDLPPELDALDSWRWDGAMTEAALAFFDGSAGRGLGPRLRALQEEARALDLPWCWISGDPNPSNWGERADGTLVLFDWELVRRGVPALDLAIVVPGLGTAAQYEAVAAAYVEERSRLTDVPLPRQGSLPRQIAVAKVWTVVSLLRECVAGNGRVPASLRAHLTRSVPPWIADLTRPAALR